MATGQVSITVNSTGGPDGSTTFTSNRPLPSVVQSEVIVTLINGATTVTVPTGTTIGIIVPPNAATPQPNPNWGGTLTLKGVTGDTGVPISTIYATPLQWDTAPATFVLTSNQAGTCQVVFR